MNKNISFRIQLGIIFSVGMLLLALTSTLFVSNLSSRQFRDRMVGEGVKLTESFAEQSTLALLYQSADSASEVAAVVLSFPDIEGVEVSDVDGGTLYAAGTALETPLAGSRSDIATVTADIDHHWEFLAPVLTGLGNEYEEVFGGGGKQAELIGYVRVLMGKETLRKMEADIFLYHLAISLGLAVILLLLLVAITNRLTRPLQNLARIMRLAALDKKNIRAELAGTSDIREMENAFNLMMMELEGQREALELARDQALASAQLKSEFAANVSHELRTPMNGVLGMLDLLVDGGLTDRQREYVSVAKNSADALLLLIDELLSFSKSEAGSQKLNAVTFNLHDLLNEVVSLLATQAQKKQIDLVYTVDETLPVNVIADQRRLRQILVNLVGNAIKFTECGGVCVEVSRANRHRECDELLISVTDSGVGITAEQQARIFEAFCQADESTTRQYGGTGLGLTISKQLVTQMSGDIGVDSDYGKGSCFWIKLPVQVASASQQRAPVFADFSRQLRVLIVDNSCQLRRGLAAFFSREKVYWDEAACYGSAVHKLKEAVRRPFSLVIVGEMLDGGRGSELMSLVEGLPECANTYGLVVAFHAERASATAPYHGRWTYISRPVRQDELTGSIVELYGENRAKLEPLRADGSGCGEQFFGLQVLVVDDDRVNRQVAQAMLETLGCRVFVAGNGAECIEKVSRSRFDIILMDCHMPVMDGYEATVTIRRNEGHGRRIPVIALTANLLNAENEFKCKGAGMDDYLAKPLSLESLGETLTRWVPTNAAPGPATADKTSSDGETGGQRMSAPGHQLSDCTESGLLHGVFDRTVIDRLRADLGDTVRDIAEALAEDLPGYLAALNTACEIADCDALANAAHAIKGSASNVGATPLVDAAAKLEAGARAGNLVEVHTEVAAINAHVEALISRLAAGDLEHFALGRQSEAEPREALPTENTEEATVLIVDDDRSARIVMAQRLLQDGYKIAQASDGMQALAYCEESVPDLILMDALMPRMDGFTACAELQKRAETKDVPILVITALDDDDSISTAFRSGATDYIPKPVNYSVLSRRIHHLVKARGAMRAIEHLAYCDTLTGLPNRAMFTERMQEAIDRLRNGSEQMAVLFLDLDRFKLVNDTHGHDIGDMLLKYFSERVQGCLRKDDLVARFGGDEFAILLTRVKSREAVSLVAQKIFDKLSSPFVYLDTKMYVSTSIGIAMIPEHGEDISTLLKSADMAMYRAKKTGQHVWFYEQQLQRESKRRLQLENDLRGALEREEFVVYYQPQEQLLTGAVTTFEALLRWQHPERGLLGPNEFISLAEETQQIGALGEWVLRDVCQQLRRWRASGFDDLRVAVNLSGKQLIREDILDAVKRSLDEAQLPPRCLELEITESTIMEDPEQVIKTLKAFKAMGLSIAIDDFGTGYSSLSYLRQFPIDVIKIDRSFVSEIIDNQVDADIVKTIIDLAHILDVDVVAEGVETEEQKGFLTDQGCDILQGFYLSRPADAARIEETFLASQSEVFGLVNV